MQLMNYSASGLEKTASGGVWRWSTRAFLGILKSS
jgi:hypothetical protein